jgi:uncharacterized Zn finger protein (UPF0148 family)
MPAIYICDECGKSTENRENYNGDVLCDICYTEKEIREIRKEKAEDRKFYNGLLAEFDKKITEAHARLAELKKAEE